MLHFHPCSYPRCVVSFEVADLRRVHFLQVGRNADLLKYSLQVRVHPLIAPSFRFLVEKEIAVMLPSGRLLDELRIDLLDEPAWFAGDKVTPAIPRISIADRQLLLGTRDGNVK